MATRSLICKELPNGRYRTVFCLDDGFLDITGCILYDIYDTEKKLDKLLALGDLKSVGTRITKKITTDDIIKKYVCEPYDINQTTEEYKAKDLTFKQLKDYAEREHCEFIYMFTKEGTWRYSRDCFGVKGRYTKEQIYEEFEDLKEWLEKNVAVADRYINLTEREKLVDKLGENMDAEINALRKARDRASNTEKDSFSQNIKLMRNLQVYIMMNDDKFDNKQLKALTSTNKILSKISKIKLDQKELINGNQFTLAVEKFFKLYAKEDEMC